MIHWYGLIIGLAIVVGWSIAERIEPKVNKVLPWVLIFGILGARLYHVIDLWSYYSQNLGQIVAVWNGGLGIFGGIGGGVIGLLIYQVTHKLTKNETWKMLAASITGLPIAQAIGRWGNLVNNELWGAHHEPLFLYESILDLILFGILWRLYRRGQHSMIRVGTYFAGYGVIRLILEPLKPSPWRVGYAVAGGLVVLGVLLIGLTKYTPIGYAKKHE